MKHAGNWLSMRLSKTDPSPPGMPAGAAYGGNNPGISPPRPGEPVTQSATHLRQHAPEQPGAPRVGRPRHAGKRQANSPRTSQPPQPRLHAEPLQLEATLHSTSAGDVSRSSKHQREARSGRRRGAGRPGEWSAALPVPQKHAWAVSPDIAPEFERPWDRHLTSDSGA
jgi:hypothetical protein